MNQTPRPAAENGPPSGDAANIDPFDAPIRREPETDVEALVVDIDGYAGPLDVLLDLARSQRVDLRRISMVALVDQYLAFVEAAKAQRLELAADYLVMAAWLAYLKSKLLLPLAVTDGDEPSADAMAAQLAFQLQRLEAMRRAADGLMRLPQVGAELFPRGAPEGEQVVRTSVWRAELYELLQAYARQRVAAIDRTYTVTPPKVYSIEEARARLARILGAIPDWVDLASLSPLREIDAPLNSVIASAFNAALEFAKHGRIDLRQRGAFEPIYIKRRDGAPDPFDEPAERGDR